MEAVIVQIADALSGARPGARGDSLEEYVERLREFEEIASRQDGVERVYAMHPSYPDVALKIRVLRKTLESL